MDTTITTRDAITTHQNLIDAYFDETHWDSIRSGDHTQDPNYQQWVSEVLHAVHNATQCGNPVSSALKNLDFIHRRTAHTPRNVN